MGRTDNFGPVPQQAAPAKVAIPLLISDRGYGPLWNSPASGRVELAETGTRWAADSAHELPLSVIVCDFFRWTHLGEWKFDGGSGPTRPGTPTSSLVRRADG